MNYRQHPGQARADRLSQLRIRLFFMLFNPDQDTGLHYWPDVLSLTVRYTGGYASLFSRN